MPDGSYKWIDHYMDHCETFFLLFPLKVLHSDNGHEFINDIIRSTIYGLA